MCILRLSWKTGRHDPPFIILHSARYLDISQRCFILDDCFMREQILDLLRDRGPMPVYDIAQELGVDTQVVASRLAKARLSGRVHMLADQVERRRRSTGSRITGH